MMRDIFFDADGKYIKSKKNSVMANPVFIKAQSRLEYLGNVDAKTEWDHNRDLARHMFLHTDAYSSFLKDDSLILLGRTGVGKTAILLCIEDDIKVKDKNAINCSYVVSIDFSDILKQLAKFSDVYSVTPVIISSEIKNLMDIIIKTAIMKKVVEKEENKKSQNIRAISSFLCNLGLQKERNFEKFWKTFLTATANKDYGDKRINASISITQSIISIINGLTSKGFEEAEENLNLFLNNKERVLVLVDSLDEYDVNSQELMIATKSLIQLCFDYYNNVENKIYMKISLPSEIYNKVLTRLPAKQNGNTVVIQWKVKELVVLLALRIYNWARNHPEDGFDFCDDFSYESFYSDREVDSYTNAKKLINNILPEVCPNTLSFDFLTLPYCLRHTLKKPREVIFMFNVIIDNLYRQNDMYYFIKNPQEIENIVHSTQNNMIQSALSMYAVTYPTVYSAVNNVLTNQHFIFDGKELAKIICKAIKDTQNEQNHFKTTSEHINYSSANDLDEIELSRIVLESGLIGPYLKKSNIINPHNSVLHNEESICVLYADFSFETSAITVDYRTHSNKQYVVHPMCYETYGCIIDKNTLVYPGLDDSDDFITTVISEPKN